MTLSSVTKERFERFRNVKRGYVSLILFVGISITTSLAEFIANDRPLIIWYNNSFYFPIFKNYPETTFGGTFETSTDYKEMAVQSLIKKKGWMLFPPIPFGVETINNQVEAPSPPSWENWLGTDDQGRDVLARLIYGLRTSILFGLILTFFSAMIGIFAGAFQGYFGGCTDLFFQRIIEVLHGLPTLYLLMILSSLVIPNFWWLLSTMAIFSWMPLAIIVRAEFFRARTLDYVKAAEALGVPSLRLITRHILPNAMVPSLVYIPFMVSGAITTLTALDFLGFGLPPGSASLGELLTQAKNNIHDPWLGFTGFFAIAFLLSLLVFMGEGAREAFSPFPRTTHWKSLRDFYEKGPL